MALPENGTCTGTFAAFMKRSVLVPSIALNQYPPRDKRADDWSGIKRIVHP